MEHGSGDPELGKTLMEKAAYWGISTEVTSRVLPKVGNMLKQADAAPSVYALSTVNPLTGEKLNLYPIDTPENLVKSARQFTEDRANLYFTQRRDVARTILTKAAGLLNNSENRIFLASACVGLAPVADIAAEMQKRSSLLSSNQHAAHITKLRESAAMVKKSSPSYELSAQSAELLGKLDDVTGLASLYKRGLALPEDVCCSVQAADLRKIASETVLLTTGNRYSREALVQCEPILGQARDLSGNPDLAKLASAAAALDAHDAAMLEEIMLTEGHKPYIFSL
jgi:hypothetical protein